MADLSRSQLATLARNAGFTGRDVDIAVAVALAESGGNPRAHNTNASTGDNSYGAWQINMLGSMGPDRRKALGITSNDALFDPATNARAARMVFKSQGWAGWTTYTRGTYKKFMSGDNGSDTPTPTSAAVDPVLGIGASINSFGETFMKGFASFGAVAVAVVLLILGVVILLRSQVMAVAPTGKIGKLAKMAKKVGDA